MKKSTFAFTIAFLVAGTVRANTAADIAFDNMDVLQNAGYSCQQQTVHNAEGATYLIRVKCSRTKEQINATLEFTTAKDALLSCVPEQTPICAGVRNALENE